MYAVLAMGVGFVQQVAANSSQNLSPGWRCGACMTETRMSSRLMELAKNPVLIPGIYNYCDRWCECCAFTHRCLSFVERQEPTDASTDLAGALQNSFEDSLSILREVASRMGLDPAELERVDPEAMEAEARAATEARADPACQAAHRYAHLAGARLDASRLPAELSLPGRPGPVEVIRWYQHLIGAKVYRAIRGSADSDHQAGEIQTDANGSAKIALLAIARSRKAWLGLDGVPAGPDAPPVTRIVAHLDLIAAEIDRRFPVARLFLRPGFDEPTA